MTTTKDKNIPSRRGQRLIQIQLIYSLPFVTTMKKNTTTTTKKKLDRFFNAVGPGLPRNKHKSWILTRTGTRRVSNLQVNSIKSVINPLRAYQRSFASISLILCGPSLRKSGFSRYLSFHHITFIRGGL